MVYRSLYAMFSGNFCGALCHSLQVPRFRHDSDRRDRREHDRGGRDDRDRKERDDRDRRDRDRRDADRCLRTLIFFLRSSAMLCDAACSGD